MALKLLMVVDNDVINIFSLPRFPAVDEFSEGIYFINTSVMLIIGQAPC